jgi:hypothetical protein
MADTAAHLVDRVIPEVPVRQWVLSLPFALRYRVAFDGALLGRVLGIFARAVFRSLRRRARDYGIPRGQCGAVTFIQSFGSALNLTPHLHMLTLDGVYAAQDGEAPRFYPLRAPEKSDVMAVAVRVAEQVASLKTPWRDGTTHVIFEPQELMEKLAVLVPAPRLNLTRFHGILAPAAKWRASVVPAPAATPSEPPCECENGACAKTPRRNYAWALLMARVFEVDVLECPDCKGRLRILAAIHPPENTRKILDCLGLPPRAPPLKPAATLPNQDPY